MLDPNLFSQTPDLVRQSLTRRGAGPDTFAAVDRLVGLVERRRALQTEGDRCRAVRNELSPKIGAAMKAGQKEDAERMKGEVRAATERAAQLDAELEGIAAEEQDLLLNLPNLVDAATPDGKSDADNPVVRTWGTPGPAGKPHDELAVALGMYDPERAAKISGARFSVITDGLARLERALLQFFLDLHTDHGYREVMVPYIVRRSALVGTNQLPKFEEDLFKLTTQLAGEDAFLIPTAEVPVTNLHQDEILEEAQLPLRYTAFTPCFRSEAGAAGRDTRGLIRLHQFHKVEIVHIVKPEDSAQALEDLTGHAEKCLQLLGLPYQVVARCAADVGFGGARGYDLEVWLPGQQAYREISSCTNFHDFQARRLKLRFKREGEKKTTLLHTLNGSALALGRTLVAIVENYQQPDGSVVVPEVLRPYMKGLARIGG
ncbi:MAG: serine--tRNA ligase [Myxococcota bacterium]